jgi:hypothetical protein
MAGNKTETQVGLKINGEVALKTIRDLENEVKMLNKEMRLLPVGSKEFTEKAKELGTVQNSLQGVRNSAKEVRDQMAAMGDGAKKANSDILGMTSSGRMIKDLGETFNGVRMAVQANIAAMGALKLAMAATGIGLLITALGSLYAYFTKTDEGAMKLEGITTGLGLAFRKVTDIAGKMGEWLVNAFENPKQALTDLADMVKNNLINRFTAFGVILDGILNLDFKEITDGTIQLTTGVKDATSKMAAFGKEIEGAVKVGMDLAKMRDALDEAESRAIVTSAKLGEQVSKLLLQAKDRTKTEAERIALVDRASRLETQKMNDDLKIAQQRLDIANLEFKQTGENAETSDELRKKAADAEVSLIEIRKSSIDLQEKISNRRNALLDADAAARLKQNETEKKQQEEKEKSELDYLRKLTDYRVAAVKDEWERKALEINAAAVRQQQDAVINGQATFDLIDAIEAERKTKLDALEIEKTEKEAAKAQEKKDKLVSDGEEEIAIETERMLVAQENVVASETAKEERIFEIKRAAAEKTLKLNEDTYGKESTQAKKSQLEIEKLEAGHQKRRTETGVAAGSQRVQLELKGMQEIGKIMGSFADLLAADEKSRKEHAGVIKAFKTAELVTAGAVEIGEIWKNANSSPLNVLNPAYGSILASIQTGLAVARTIVGVSNIQKTKFEKGGLITPKGGYLGFGQRHSEGGINLVDGKTGQNYGEVERGEHLAVFSRSAYQNNKGTIDALLNSSLYNGGAPVAGRTFADGGVINMGETISPTQATNAVSQFEQQTISELRAMRQDLRDFPKQLTAVVVYEQQKEKNTDAAKAEQFANA